MVHFGRRPFAYGCEEERKINIFLSDMKQRHPDDTYQNEDESSTLRSEYGQSDEIRYGPFADTAFTYGNPLESGGTCYSYLVEAKMENDTHSLEHIFVSDVDVGQFQTIVGTVLHLASIIGNTDLAQSGLDNGISVNQSGTGSKCSPLSLAVQYGHHDIISLLINRGADVNQKNKDGLSCLHIAVLKNNMKAVHYLLRAGAKVNIADNRNNVAIHYAAVLGHTDILEILIAYGGDVNYQNKFKECPLHMAIRSGKLDVIQALVLAGCDVDKSFQGGTVSPIHLLVTKYLDNDWLKFRCLLQVLVLAGSEVNAFGYSTLETPLYRAISLNKDDRIEALLIFGADPNISCPFGITAIQNAFRNQDPHVINLLVHCGIDWRRERWVENLIASDKEEIKECVDLIRCWRNSPPSLQNICRISIRRRLGSNLFLKCQHLSIPFPLQKLLLLLDICRYPLPANLNNSHKFLPNQKLLQARFAGISFENDYPSDDVTAYSKIMIELPM